MTANNMSSLGSGNTQELGCLLTLHGHQRRLQVPSFRSAAVYINECSESVHTVDLTVHAIEIGDAVFITGQALQDAAGCRPILVLLAASWGPQKKQQLSFLYR